MIASPSLRGAAFAPLLAQQNAYSAREGRRSRFGLMVPEAFVRGIRDLGYRSNGDAIAELIDNSIQAGADRVDVLTNQEAGRTGKAPSQLAIVDNGHGMEPDMIRMAVMWGGTHRENDRQGLGRYGYGLPCASVSLGRRFKVISQTGDGALYAVTLDLDDITRGDCLTASGEVVVPPPEPAALPDFVARHLAAAYPEGWASGTVILIDKLDRLEWSSAAGLRENLRREFAVTYHKLRGQAALYVDGVFIEPIDPLFLTPGFDLFALDDDRAQPLDPMRVRVQHPGQDTYEGAMTLRYAWLPPSFGSVDKDRDAVGLNANPRFSILKDYHGVIFSRNGRLIDVQTKLPWTSFINNDRYIKVEVEFSASLDEAFGVTTSKQQVTVSSRIWDVLRDAGLPKAIEQLRQKVQEAKALRRQPAFRPPPGVARPSERAMDGSGPLVWNSPKPGRVPELRRSTYRMAFEHAPKAPLFRVSHHQDERILHLNTASAFHDLVYDAAGATPEFRTVLEVALLASCDLIGPEDGPDRGRRQEALAHWSRQVESALLRLTAFWGERRG